VAAPRTIHRSKPAPKARPDTSRLTEKEARVSHQKELIVALRQPTHSEDQDSIWEKLKQSINTAATKCLGLQVRNQPDWFAESADIMMPAFTAKRITRHAVLAKPTASNKAAYQAAKAEVQRRTRLALHHYWNDLCTFITKCSDTVTLQGCIAP